jgi:hypothetical protein
VEHSLRVDVGGNSTAAINADNLVPLSGTRKTTTAGLGELRWARRAGVSAVASSAEIAHGRLRRIIRYNNPPVVSSPNASSTSRTPSNPVTLLYQFAVSSGSASTTLLATTFSFSQLQTTNQPNKQPNLGVVAPSTPKTASLPETLLKTPRAQDIHSAQTHSSPASGYRITRASPAPSKLELHPLPTTLSITKMRSFQTIVALLFAFVAFALAQEPSYDATVYVTSTVYRVNTVTLSGTPTASIANSTSTIAASVASIIPSYGGGNGTTAVPTGVLPSTSVPAFTGAASHLNVNALAAALVAGVGYLAL